jgi:hypothetical protein
MGTAFTYQGLLIDGGNPANGEYDFEFKLYDASSGGTQIGSTVTLGDVTVTEGLFTVKLDFGSGAFNGDARWLDIGVRPGASTGAYTTLDPRQGLTPSPYALALPGLWTQQNPTSPNIIGGYSGNSVTSGVKGATIGGGGRSGFTNRVTDDYGTVGGGDNNQAGDNAGTTTDAPCATVGGGAYNTASGVCATVGGGSANTASDHHATVGGGWYNYATASYATVGGGRYNDATADYATIAGGGPSDPTNPATTKNVVYDDYGTIGGGGGNRAGSDDADTTNAPYATVGGGANNEATADYATVGGGGSNEAVAYGATVGGGLWNSASGSFATVPGGFRAKASHYGQMAYASGQFYVVGDAQTSVYVMRIERTCSAGVWYDLYLDGNAADPANYLTIADGQTMVFHVLVVGREDPTTGNESAGYYIYGVVENVGGTATLLNWWHVIIWRDDTNWDVQVATLNDALFVQVTGNGENIRWVARMETAEVSW